MVETLLEEWAEAALPESLREIKEIIGPAALLALLDQWGGKRMSVPKRLKPDHILIRVLGDQAAQLFIAHYGGELMNVPAATAAKRRLRNRSIIEAYNRGCSVKQLSAQHDLTEMHIYRILNRPD